MEAFEEIFDSLVAEAELLLDQEEKSAEIDGCFAKLRHTVNSAEFSVRGHPELANARDSVAKRRAKLNELEGRRRADTITKTLPPEMREKFGDLESLNRTSSQRLGETLKMAIDAEQHSQSATLNLMAQREALDRSKSSAQSIKTSVDSAATALGKVKRWWI